jgi:hypothetical protein
MKVAMIKIVPFNDQFSYRDEMCRNKLLSRLLGYSFLPSSGPRSQKNSKF